MIKQLLLALIAFFTLTSMALAAVNLNTATKEELQAVDGIGPKKAEASLHYRNRNGSFKSVDDLKNVKGFGDKTVAKMRPELTVDGGTSAKKEGRPAKPGKKNSKAGKK